MYHISDDVRAQESAQRICDTLLQCSKHKDFSDITISLLKAEYGISRTTFYRLFDNLTDVLEYMIDQMGKEILLHVKGSNLKEMTIHTIDALLEHRELIQLLSASGQLHLFQQKQEQYFPLSKFAEASDIGEGAEYFHGILAQLIPTAMDIWVKNGMRETPEEVYRKLSSSLRVLGLWFSSQ